MAQQPGDEGEKPQLKVSMLKEKEQRRNIVGGLRQYTTPITILIVGVVILAAILLTRPPQSTDISPQVAASNTPAEVGTIHALETSQALLITPTIDPAVAVLQTQNAELVLNVTNQAGTAQAIAAQPTQTPQPVLPTITPLPPTEPPTIVVVQPTQTPQILVVTATSNPVVQTAPTATVERISSSEIVAPTNVSAATSGLASFNPGGQSFGQYANDVAVPPGAAGDCGHIWQATNGQNLAWTTVFCNWQATTPGPQMQWTIPTKAIITGTGTLSFDLYRNLGASQSESPDPYEVANAAQSPLGLAWFIHGTGGDVCVNGNCKSLISGKTYQLGFPANMSAFYAVAFTLSNGNVEFWQGEKQQEADSWPIPAASAGLSNSGTRNYQLAGVSSDAYVGKEIDRKYNAVWTSEGRLWQPTIPTASQREAHNVAIKIMPGRYSFDGNECAFYLDTARNGQGSQNPLVAAYDTGLEFTVITADGLEAWGLVECRDGETTGFEMQYLGQ